MKMLLASGGITNVSIKNALIELLGKPIAESNALFIPTAVHAIPGSPLKIRNGVQRAISDPLGDLGWKSLGLLELTALSTLRREVWLPALRGADALLVGGGDCQYLCGWMELSGFGKLLPEILEKAVYVGQSAGSMVMTSHGTTYGNHTLPADTKKCFKFLNFGILPHLDHELFPNNSLDKLEKVAAIIPMPVYLIDDQTALKVTDDGMVEVISEGNWKLVNG